MTYGPPVLLARADLDGLLQGLRAAGYRVIGPRLSEGAVVLGPLERAADLPLGVRDQQEPGRYRLEHEDDGACFAYTVGPHSAKSFLHPSRLRLFRATRTADGVAVEPAEPAPGPVALVGVRGCGLAAMRIQDRVFLEGPYVDAHYAARARDRFVVAVHCGRAVSTCFCASQDTGPRAGPGYDLALTELLDAERHVFVVDVGSARGAELLRSLPVRAASAADLARRDALLEATAASQTRGLPAHTPELLRNNPGHPRWDEVATRCLSCANCTMVCPTCFCTSVSEVSDLAGDVSERVRSWDSCFSEEFSYIHGGAVRKSPSARFRQWITHKLSSWHEQFDSSGCTGCGRCLTWCPVGIDITEEVAAIDGAEGDDDGRS